MPGILFWNFIFKISFIRRLSSSVFIWHPDNIVFMVVVLVKLKKTPNTCWTSCLLQSSICTRSFILEVKPTSVVHNNHHHHQHHHHNNTLNWSFYLDLNTHACLYFDRQHLERELKRELNLVFIPDFPVLIPAMLPWRHCHRCVFTHTFWVEQVEQAYEVKDGVFFPPWVVHWQDGDMSYRTLVRRKREFP